MSERHPDHIARSSAEGPVPGQTAIEVDREIQFRQLLWLGLGLVATTALSGVIVFFMLRGFLEQEREQSGPPPAMVAPPVQVPGARLLARPERELDRVRQLEAEQVNGYGWVDQGQGIARIPVDRAIELVAAKGLPHRAATPPPAGAGAAEPDAGLMPPLSPAGAAAPAPQTQPGAIDPGIPAATPAVTPHGAAGHGGHG